MNTFHLKSTFRSLWKNRSYSFLNITGLAIGLACAALLFLWLEDELTFDTNFEKRNNLYLVMENQTFNDVISTVRVTSGLLSPAVKIEIPGIKNSTRMTGGATQALFSFRDKVLYENGNHVDSSFFNMFQLKFIRGNARHAFDQLHSLVITEKMAGKFFDLSDPIGQILKMDNDQLFTITGVVQNLPENTSLASFEWLAPFDLVLEKYDWLNHWDANGIFTFVELQPGTDVAQVDKQLYGFLKSKKNTIDTKCFLFPMPEWHLYDHFTNGKQDGGGQIKYVRLFTLIASLILIIACVNFMNLATAKSEQRAKEVGVRKALGAGRKKLISQFIGESLIMSCIAIVFAVGITYVMLPLFNSLVEKHLTLNLLNPLHFFGLLTIGLFSGLLAGSYPAFYLSSFNPVLVLKGLKIKTSVPVIFIRKGLVTGQFVISITLIICTVIIYQQVDHTKTRELGYHKQDILYMKVQGKIQDHLNAVKTDLLNTGVVENVTFSMNPTFQLGWWSGDSFTWQGKDIHKDVLITVEDVTPEYISTMGLKIKEGRGFYADTESNFNDVIINESLARQMGHDSQIGNIITQTGSSGPNNNWKIVGIVKDFVFGNIYSSAVAPMILMCNPAPFNYLTLRLRSGTNLKQSLAKVEAVMKSNNPEYPFEYKFLDDEFDKLFKTETLIEKLSGVFALLAILIACLGLFGLAAYTAGRRTKEMGIRKVLGASVSGIAVLLSRDFLQLVILACFISFPAAWWFMREWLGNYEYRTPIYWWVFAATGLGAFGIALITVSLQTIKAAIINPIISLRRE